MTSVRFYMSQDGIYLAFETEGHAGHGNAGNDIVCAAVSAATELVITILEQFSVELRLDIHEESARIRCEVAGFPDEKTRHTAKRVLDGYRKYLSEVSQEYPHNLKCRMITE